MRVIPGVSQRLAATRPAGWPRIVPHLIYDDVAEAIDWLSGAFGFRERTAARHTSLDGTVGRAQLELLDGLITLGTPSVHGDSPRRGVSSMLYIYVDDVDRHYQCARAAGATIVMELRDQPWGDRLYQATDHAGHRWTFAQHLLDADAGDQH